MNILFFVSSLLIIFSFFSIRTLQLTGSLESERRCFSMHMEMLRKSRNIWQNKQFVNATKKTSNSEEKKQKILQNYSSHRKSYNPSFLSKINIHAFLKEDSCCELYQSSLENLLRNLYGQKNFVKEQKIKNWEKTLLEEIKKKAKNISDLRNLQQLTPESEPLKSLYFKMLKGSGFYDIQKNIGYPPIGDFVSIKENEKKPIYFYYTSYPIIEAVFGNRLAEEILQIEEKKSQISGCKKVLKKSELQELLSKNFQKNKNLFQLEEVMSFSKKSLPLQSITIANTKDGILFRIPLEDKMNRD